ncbi:hypothetical protein F5884DRAFT_100790 [Xylogone sp. PMI_703]|nr:hypothetical protein F5884DRAFT_100790 [Xylogone sp. PMI_703]
MAFQIPTPKPRPKRAGNWENESSLARTRDTYPFIDPRRFENKLVGKVVLITHTTRGLGRSSALAFAAAGASIACVAHNAQSLAPLIMEIRQKYNVPVLPVIADPLSPATPPQIVSYVEKNLGPVDILLNLSPPGYIRPIAHEPSFAISSDWWRTLSLVLHVPVALTHAVLPSMIARHSGIIISAVSVAPALNIPFTSAASVARTALLKFHHLLDNELRPKGILSYAVHPGLIPSFMHEPLSQNTPSFSARSEAAGFNLDEGTPDLKKYQQVPPRPADFAFEPRMKEELTAKMADVEWSSAGLATGTFVALACDPRLAILSGLWINAERDLGVVLSEVERRGREAIDKEKLYVLKIEEF